MIVKILSEHIIMVILHFGVNMWFLNKNNFIYQNYPSFTETREMDTENILRKCKLDQLNFLDLQV